AIDEDLGLEIVDLGETDDVTSRVRDLLGGAQRTILVDNHMWAERVLWLQDDVGAARITTAGRVLAPMREIKDAYELDQLRRAGAAIDDVHSRVPEMLR